MLYSEPLRWKWSGLANCLVYQIHTCENNSRVSMIYGKWIFYVLDLCGKKCLKWSFHITNLICYLTAYLHWNIIPTFESTEWGSPDLIRLAAFGSNVETSLWIHLIFLLTIILYIKTAFHLIITSNIKR